MSNVKRLQYYLEKKAKRKTGYPLATIAYYGEDAFRASKVAVGIIQDEEKEEVTTMRKWYSDVSDVRKDAAILKDILHFLEEQQVKRVLVIDRIIGCPHEEGIDYPNGEKCPQCPYWANRNRWTGALEK